MTEFNTIVVGGSMAGLLAAAALARKGQSVLVLERDTPPESPAPRKAVPQSTQVHALLDSGRASMEWLLPGLFDGLTEAGSARVDFGLGLRWYHAGHYKVRCETPYSMQLQTRPLLEHHVRARVQALEGVTVRYGQRCEGVWVDAGKLRGVRLEGGVTLSAAKVVLATGRGPRAIRMLEEAGLGTPRERGVDIGIGYATGTFTVPANWPGDVRALLTYGTRSETRRHGLAFRVEGGLLQVTLMGYHGDHPPADLEGFRAWAATLERNDIAQVLNSAQLVGQIRRLTCPRQHRYDLHRMGLPQGLMVVGDAACALDPVFGQGMSVAALQARALAEGGDDTRAFMRKAARIADRAWLITVLEAQRYPQAKGGATVPGVGLVHRWLDRIAAASATEPVVHRAFLNVMNLHAPATALFTPDVAWRVMRGSAASQPALLPAPL